MNDASQKYNSHTLLGHALISLFSQF